MKIIQFLRRLWGNAQCNTKQIQALQIDVVKSLNATVRAYEKEVPPLIGQVSKINDLLCDRANDTHRQLSAITKWLETLSQKLESLEAQVHENADIHSDNTDDYDESFIRIKASIARLNASITCLRRQIKEVHEPSPIPKKRVRQIPRRKPLKRR